MKKHNLMKSVTALAIGCAILCSSTMGVEAYPTFTKGKAKGFDDEWERTVNVYYINTNALVGTMIYGFNRSYIDEDYVWTQSLSYKARPVIKNANGTYKGAWKKGSLSGYSKIEVRHAGNSPKYRIKLKTDLSKSNFSVSSPIKSNAKMRQ